MSCRRQRYANVSWPTRRRSFNSSTDSRGRQRSKKKVCNFLETVFRLSSVKTFYSFISIECVNHLRLNLKQNETKKEITILCIFFASFNSIQIANRLPFLFCIMKLIKKHEMKSQKFNCLRIYEIKKTFIFGFQNELMEGEQKTLFR